MSLKINNWKKFIPYVIWGIIGLLLLIFIIKVSVFEAQYYGEKEGSERADADTGVVVYEPEPVDETEPTTEQVNEHIVPADHPRYITISKLPNVNKARIIPVWVKANGELGTPNNIFDVGWYGNSGKPGQGETLLLDGHNGGPTKIGVLKYLPDLVEGNEITIERGDGKKYIYKVVDNIAVPLDEADAYMKKAQESPVEGKESLSIITCTGTWSEQQKTYLSRQFVRAVLDRVIE